MAVIRKVRPNDKSGLKLTSITYQEKTKLQKCLYISKEFTTLAYESF